MTQAGALPNASPSYSGFRGHSNQASSSKY